MKIRQIPIAAVKSEIEGKALQRRLAENLSEDVIEDYSSNIDKILEEVPIEICEYDGDYYLTDGYHRLEAYKRAYPSATSFPANVIEKLTSKAVYYKAISANFNHGLGLTAKEKKRDVIDAAVALSDEYEFYCEDTFISQLHELTNVPIPQLKRYTTEIRKPIKWLRTRKIAQLILAGKSQRNVASELGIDKGVVERAEKERKNSPFYPLPNDPMTFVGVYKLLYRSLSFEESDRQESGVEHAISCESAMLDDLEGYEHKDLLEVERRHSSDMTIYRSLEELREHYPPRIDRKSNQGLPLSKLQKAYDWNLFFLEGNYKGDLSHVEDGIKEAIFGQMLRKGLIADLLPDNEDDFIWQPHDPQTKEPMEWDGETWSPISQIKRSPKEAEAVQPIAAKPKTSELSPIDAAGKLIDQALAIAAAYPGEMTENEKGIGILELLREYRSS